MRFKEAPHALAPSRGHALHLGVLLTPSTNARPFQTMTSGLSDQPYMCLYLSYSSCIATTSLP